MLALENQQFRDLSGRVWDLSLNIGLAIELKKKCGVDFLNVTEKAALEPLNDIETLVDVLYLICEEQAKEQSISPSDFARRLGGDTIGAASDALMESLVLFTQPAMRPAIRALLEKSREIRAKTAEVMVKHVTGRAMQDRIERHEAEIDEQIAAAIRSSSFGSLPE